LSLVLSVDDVARPRRNGVRKVGMTTIPDGRVVKLPPSHPGSHAVLMLDQAGWHLSHQVAIPPNVTLVPLPAKCPELNPVEDIWRFMRDNRISNRVLLSRLGV
jgi:hypothetical protein